MSDPGILHLTLAVLPCVRFRLRLTKVPNGKSSLAVEVNIKECFKLVSHRVFIVWLFGIGISVLDASEPGISVRA